MTRSFPIDLNHVELKYYPFMISLDKCNGSCNSINDLLSMRICVLSKAKQVNVKVVEMIRIIKEAKTLVKHISCDCKCKFSSKTQKKYKNIWTKIEHFKNAELNALVFYHDTYIKTKIGTYDDKVYTKFRGLNVPEYVMEYKSFIVISIDTLLVHKNKYYLEVYLEICFYKIINKKLIDYIDENPFETDENQSLINRSYKSCITIELI